MHTIQSTIFWKTALWRVMPAKRTLSYYLPAGTQYFYGYPAGEDAGFVNLVPPETEELVAVRPFCCAGKDVSVISFAATDRSCIGPKLSQQLRLPRIISRQNTVLPASIDVTLRGKERNDAIKQALLKHVKPGTFMMAQPYTDAALAHLYQIPPSLSFWLNDKHSMPEYISPEFLPKRLGEYESGQAFVEQAATLPLPFVAKASASSSGDGVYICRTPADVERSAKKLGQLEMTVIVEQYIDAVKNYGVHFGIPADSSKPIDIIGVNEQLTSPEGQFLGGVIRSQELPVELVDASRYLRHEVLPWIRKMGWYGIGGFDVLIDSQGMAYFIDCNFRMTGMSAFHFMVRNERLHTPLISFSASFTGTQAAFERAVLAPLGPGICLRLIAVSHHDGVWRCNGAICYQNHDNDLPVEAIEQLLGRGLESEALTQVVESATQKQM